MRVYIDGLFVTTFRREYIEQQERLGWPHSQYKVLSVDFRGDSVYLNTSRNTVKGIA